MRTTKSCSKDGHCTENSPKKPNAENAHPHAELQLTNRSACGNKRPTHAVIANLRILRASMTINDWRLLKRKNKYTSQFAFHAKAETTQEHQSNVLNAGSKRQETNLASHDSVAKTTQRGAVWNAISHRARYAAKNLMFLKERLISASDVYFRQANAVQNDLAAPNIEVPTKI